MAMASTSVTTHQRHGGDELIALLKSELTGAEQQQFVDGFHAYMTYDARRDFVVSLDDVYEWLGFTRKSNAMKVLNKHLQDGMHFKPEVSALLQLEQCTEDGHNGMDRSKPVFLTVHGF